jgi:N-acetylglucosaminyldiphosphoundecaprenol N-acetyl-beta-D-mannosaminyltransferase
MPDHIAGLDNETVTTGEPLVDAPERTSAAASEHVLDDAACQACACTHHVPLARQRGWTLRQCQGCGLISVFPQPTAAQLAALYSKQAGYFVTATPDLSATSPQPARRLHHLLAAAGIQRGRLLDVGCATGQLIYHMARLGWQTTGIDVNADAVAVARQNGLDVAESTLEGLSSADAFFDVIHMGDVLEHVQRPQHALLAARRLLRPGGLLVLRTPNADCSFARATLRLSRWLGLPWAWSEAPYHLYEFSPETLARLIDSAGLTVTELSYRRRTSFLYALGASGFFDSLKHRLKRRGRYTFDWRLITSLPKLIGVGLLLLPAFVYGALADRRRPTGYTMLVTARRPSIDGEKPLAGTSHTERRENGDRQLIAEASHSSSRSKQVPVPILPQRQRENGDRQLIAGASPGPCRSEQVPVPIFQQQAEILGVAFDLVSREHALARIESWRQTGRREYVTFSNPHSVMMARRDRHLARAFDQAGMTLPDGAGIIVAADLLGHRHHGRITGPSFMLACCDRGRQHGYRHYFCGGRQGVAETLAARLAARFPGLRVAGACSPPFRQLTPDEDKALVARINSAKPDIVWVGLGAPKQESWMAARARRIEATAMIGVGAAFDFHAGTASWAPRWVRRLGVEWAYRLAREPRRMWRRNLDSPLFLLAVVGQWMPRLLRFVIGRADR